MGTDDRWDVNMPRSVVRKESMLRPVDAANRIIELHDEIRALRADSRDADAASLQAAFWRARAIELGAAEDEYRERHGREVAWTGRRDSHISRACGIALAIAEARDDARLDGIREGGAQIAALLRRAMPKLDVYGALDARTDVPEGERKARVTDD